MEIDEKVCQFIINTLNQGETRDQTLKVDLKTKFGIGEKKRIEIMSMLMQSGAVEVHQKGEAIVYSISRKLHLKKRDTPNPNPNPKAPAKLK